MDFYSHSVLFYSYAKSLVILSLCLSLSSCGVKDQNGNYYLIPDFIENLFKLKVSSETNKEKGLSTISSSTPTTTPNFTPDSTPTTSPVKTKGDFITLPAPTTIADSTNNKDSQQQLILKNSSKYVGEQETHGMNRSPFIDKINKFTNVSMGSPYCSSFTSYILHESGVTAPITAWSPSMVSKNNIEFSKIKPADVFGLYFPSKKRIAHVGFIIGERGNYIKTREANTSPESGDLDAKSRDGDGVWNRMRNKKLMSDPRNKFSRYWKN